MQRPFNSAKGKSLRRSPSGVVYLFTGEVDVGNGGLVWIFVAIWPVAEDGPAAVGPSVGSRGRCQDQLAVLVALLDAGGRQKNLKYFV